MRGDRFKKRLPKFVGRIGDMDDLFYAEDQEFERIEKLIWDFTYGLYVSEIDKTSSPDFFLSRLEKDYGLESAGTVKDRINAILLKMKAKRTTTEEVILEICEAFGAPGIFTEKYREYAFLLNLYVNGDIDLDALHLAIREVTPAHLEDRVNITFARDVKLQTMQGDINTITWLCGEHPCGDIPYPYAVGVQESIGVGVQVGRFDSVNQYQFAGDGYKAGEIHREYMQEIVYVQDLSLDRVIDFGGGFDAE